MDSSEFWLSEEQFERLLLLLLLPGKVRGGAQVDDRRVIFYSEGGRVKKIIAAAFPATVSDFLRLAPRRTS